MRRLILPALFVAAGLAAWATASVRFPWDAAYNSDAAIPVLMANWDGWSPFHLYYFGQDRYGALPFLLMQLVHALAGLWWTPKLVALVQNGAALATVWPVSVLLGRRPAAAMAMFSVLLFMAGAPHTFSSQPYAWQLPLFFGAWAALRSRRLVLAFALAFGATWISALSAPLLLLCAIAEAFALASWRKRAITLVPVVLAGGLEGVVRGVFQLYARQHFGRSFTTVVKLELSGAGEALTKVVSDPHGPGLMLSVFTAAIAIFAVMMLLRSVREKRPLDEATATLAGLSAAFVGNVLLISLGDHFRRNELDARYLVLAECLAWLCVLQTLLVLCRRWLNDRRELAVTVVLAIAVCAAPLWRSRPYYESSFDQLHAQADALTNATPEGTFIVSGYWSVFAVAGLAPPGQLLPVAALGNYSRTVFLRDRLAKAEVAWLSDEGAEPKLRASSTGRYCWVETTLLVQDETAAPIGSWRRFKNTASRRIALQPRSGCEDARFEPQARSTVFVLFWDAARTVGVTAYDAAGAEVPLGAPERNGDLFWLKPQSEAAITRLRFAPSEGECAIQDVAVLPEGV